MARNFVRGIPNGDDSANLEPKETTPDRDGDDHLRRGGRMNFEEGVEAAERRGRKPRLPHRGRGRGRGNGGRR